MSTLTRTNRYAFDDFTVKVTISAPVDGKTLDTLFSVAAALVHTDLYIKIGKVKPASESNGTDSDYTRAVVTKTYNLPEGELRVETVVGTRRKVSLGKLYTAIEVGMVGVVGLVEFLAKKNEPRPANPLEKLLNDTFGSNVASAFFDDLTTSKTRAYETMKGGPFGDADDFFRSAYANQGDHGAHKYAGLGSLFDGLVGTGDDSLIRRYAVGSSRG